MISIPLLEIRTLDLWALLLGGVLLECISRGLVMVVKAKSSSEKRTAMDLFQLQFETAQKRRLGPSAFVETSKLERQVLAKEKALEEMIAVRKSRTERISKLVKNASLSFYGLVFVLYYSYSILSIDGTRLPGKDDGIVRTREEDAELATAFVQGLLFPLSYVGIGMRIARWGLPAPGFGALLVLWSAQVTTGKLIDGIELLVTH